MKTVLFRRRKLIIVAILFVLGIFQLHKISRKSASYSVKAWRAPDIDSEEVAKDRFHKNVVTFSREGKKLSSTLLMKSAEIEYQKKAMKPVETREKDRKTALRFENRLKVLRSRCPGWKTSPLATNWVPNKNFLINYPRRLLVCAVPKAGSTSWHMIIWAMRRKQSGLDPDTKFYTYNDTVENHKIAERLTTQQGKDLITYNEKDDDFTNPPVEKGKRLILTRHPFARMISGWHQKFLPDSPYADLMFRRYPKLQTYEREADPRHRMAWKDFAEFVAQHGDRPQSLDYHFTQAVDICKPCQYPYTYILKAESVDADESWLMRRLNISDVYVGRKGVPPGGSLVNKNPSENIKKYMSQLKDSVRRKLYDIYKEDFITFGYSFDFKTLESGGFQ